MSKLVIPEEKTPDLKEKSKPTTSEENKDKRPPLMDFLDIRASISGYQAFRDKEIGIILGHIAYYFTLCFSLLKGLL